MARRARRRPGLRINQAQQEFKPLHEILAANEQIRPTIGKCLIDGVEYDCPGEQLGSVSLLQQVGSGQFGSVYRAKLPGTEKQIAIKHIRDEQKDKPRKDMLTDLQVLAKCSSSEHIVRYYGCDVADNALLIYMELMLADWHGIYVQAHRLGESISEDALGYLALSMVRALVYLVEERHVMHRDVKPTNVLLGADNQIKLCDFGVSKAQEEQQQSLKALSNVGCNCYLPPERILISSDSKTPYNSRSDTWALGLTLVEVATQAYPFLLGSTDTAPMALITAILDDDLPTLPTGYSKEAADFAELCMTRDVNARPDCKSPLLEHPYLKAHAQRQPPALTEWYRDIRERVDQLDQEGGNNANPNCGQ